MKGEVLLSFFDKREVKEYLGFVTRSENVCFEKWGVTVVVLDATVGDGIASTNAAVDKAEAYRSAYDQITNTIMSIIVVSTNCGFILFHSTVTAYILSTTHKLRFFSHRKAHY